jgi:hypothetical protein
MNRKEIIHNLIECCKRSPKKREILKTLRKKRHYSEVAKIVGIKNPDNCLAYIKKMQVFYGLVEEKGPGVYQIIPPLKYINIDSAVHKGKKEIKIHRPPKKYISLALKKEIRLFLQDNFQEIKHPFNGKIIYRFERNKLLSAVKNFLQFIEKPIKQESLKGLPGRFYDAFATYFSISRTKRIELINSFKTLVGLFEPIIKKIAFLKTKNENILKKSLDQELIKAVLPEFNANIKEAKNEYWKEKSVEEATIRFIYPYRHIEAHEARDYKVYEVEKIVFYFFAALLFISE